MAKELDGDPERILNWPFRVFLFWVKVAEDQQKDELLLKGMVTSAAVWNTKMLVELLGMKESGERKTKEEIIKEAISKVKKVKFKKAKIEEITKRNK